MSREINDVAVTLHSESEYDGYDAAFS